MREWVAFCTVCHVGIGRAKSGTWVEARARLHAKETGHTVIIGLEICELKQETQTDAQKSFTDEMAQDE